MMNHDRDEEGYEEAKDQVRLEGPVRRPVHAAEVVDIG